MKARHSIFSRENKQLDGKETGKIYSKTILNRASKFHSAFPSFDFHFFTTINPLYPLDLHFINL